MIFWCCSAGLVLEPWFCLVVCMFFKVLIVCAMVSDACWGIHVCKVLHGFSLFSDSCWLAAGSGLQHLDLWPLRSMASALLDLRSENSGTTTEESLAGKKHGFWVDLVLQRFC